MDSKRIQKVMNEIEDIVLPSIPVEKHQTIDIKEIMIRSHSILTGEAHVILEALSFYAYYLRKREKENQ